jgi:hypothetical protein
MTELADMRAHLADLVTACAGTTGPIARSSRGSRRAANGSPDPPFIFPEIRLSRSARTGWPGLDAPDAPAPLQRRRASVSASKNKASAASKLRPVRLPGFGRGLVMSLHDDPRAVGCRQVVIADPAQLLGQIDPVTLARCKVQLVGSQTHRHRPVRSEARRAVEEVHRGLPMKPATKRLSGSL